MSELLWEFIDTIFDPELLQQGENVCFSITADREHDDPKKAPAPGYPSTRKKLERHLQKKDRQSALYVSTSTMVVDPEDGVLYNRNAMAEGLWCIVLDDIGTGTGAKGHKDDLPEGVWDGASWRIETSPENYQLGFIFDSPIRDIPAATELVKLVYSFGVWDRGGAVLGKWVRIPGSANCKNKYGDFGSRFEARLEHFPEEVVTYTPQALLELLQVGVSWDDIVTGSASKRDPRRSRGTSAYREGLVYDLRGIVDPLAEWLAQKGYVLNERYPYLDIICPWAEDHTSDSPSSTGYSPLGWGYTQRDRSMRWFNCFHDHCASHKTQEFILTLAAEGAPLVPVFDPVAPEVMRYVLDANSATWVDIFTGAHMPDKGFKLINQETVAGPVLTARKDSEDVVWRSRPLYDLLIKNPGLMKVQGTMYVPGEELLVTKQDKMKLNTCQLPLYGKGRWDPRHVDRFEGFLRYLIPKKDKCDWFLDHLASKVQDARYRGPGVFMYTNAKGSGRGTLAKMIRSLWGARNVSDIGMSNFLKGVSGDAKNDELEALWITIAETDDATSTPQHQRYENLKRFIEPGVVQISYDKKYGGRWHGPNYASVLMCSNDSAGLRIDMNDRRVMRIPNTLTPMSAEGFADFYQWFDANEWQESVWRWLAARDVSHFNGYAPVHAEENTEEYELQMLSQSPIETGVELAFEYILSHGGVFRSAQVIGAVSECAGALGMGVNGRDYMSALRRVVLKGSDTVLDERGVRIKVRASHGSAAPVRAVGKGRGADLIAGAATGAVSHGELRDAFNAIDERAMADYIKQRLANLVV